MKMFASVSLCFHPSILVSLGCYNKKVIDWFKQQTFISQNSGGWKLESRVSTWLDSWWGLSCLLAVSSHDAEIISWISTYKVANPIHGGFCSHDLITSQRPPLSNPITLGTKLQHMNLGAGHIAFSPNVLALWLPKANQHPKESIRP